MSLFDLQEVCIAIGSIATLDLSMVVDLIGIYGLKGPYRTLTTTNWFLQALSVIPRGSWGDVARCFTMIRWAVQSKKNRSERHGTDQIGASKSEPCFSEGISLEKIQIGVLYRGQFTVDYGNEQLRAKTTQKQLRAKTTRNSLERRTTEKHLRVKNSTEHLRAQEQRSNNSEELFPDQLYIEYQIRPGNSLVQKRTSQTVLDRIAMEDYIFSLIGVLAACGLSDRVRPGAAVIKYSSGILPEQGIREDSAHQPQQQQQLAQKSGRQRFRPRGQQFKKKSGSCSSGSSSSSSSGSRAEFFGFCGGKHPSTQCVAHQPQQQQQLAQQSGRQRFRPRGQQFKKKSGSCSSGSSSSSSSGSRAEFGVFCGGKNPSTQCVAIGCRLVLESAVGKISDVAWRTSVRVSSVGSAVGGGSAFLGLSLWKSACARYNSEVKVFQDLQLVEVLIQLVVPQEVVRVSQLCIVFICTGLTAGGMSRVMLSSI
ncbi:protein SUPPRESSOR OF protein 3 [Dorcoceras hygrometricum]|uniref:Protein SUPPRESSOR OF protein 3 n=1 Tax=Dorcoceras hygrometricum TaxID=472368 RepID=A0A2Z7B600_9LAMI|nr:protein SUPPRESSOR OF protein 3 [Dorcoceras hygrometricum]